MESFFSRYKNALVLLLVLVLQLLALAVQAKRPATDAADPRAVSALRYAVVTVITPPEKLLHNTGLWFRDVWWGYLDLVHVRRDNNALKNELERLRLEQASVVEDARQGQRLQHLLGFKEHYIYQTVPAQVVGTSGTDQSQVVYLDKGSDDGLKPDMPVMTADGIVGRLKDVFPSTSQLLLISDAASGVGVMLETTRTRGILKGSSYGQMQVINVSPDERIKPGDKIITSGGDQIFPRGMPVGTVDHVVPDPERDPLVDVIVRPAANLARLEEVLVISGMGGVASSQEAKDLAESEAEGEAAQKRASDILSERLPNRIDPNAPLDTNPDQNVDSTGNVVRPLAPPKPLHTDGFSPGSTPPASALTPGARSVPVKNGTEELPSKPQPAKSAALSTSSASTSGTSAAVAGTIAPRKTVTVDANGVARPTTSPRTVPGTTGTGLGTTSGAVTRVPRPALPGTATDSTAGSATGSVPSSVPRPVPRPAPAGSASVPGSAPRPASGTTATVRPSTPSTSSSSAAEGLPKTRVIDDGPVSRPQRTASTTASTPRPDAAAPKPATTTAKPGSATTKPSAANPATQKPATPVRRSPVLVPDDGSRPPSTVKPKTPATPTPQPASPPQGRGA
jgi:rod shape-determining protein MreC